MLLTGYYLPNESTEEVTGSTTPYFMVKNSWGTWWGEKVSCLSTRTWL